MAKEALFYTTLKDRKVQCFLCNHNCVINDGGLGICAVRQNNAGVLVSLNYAQVVASHIDPIEKKPLFHFLPGTRTFSLACPGCNFQCDFCQNWQISQVKETKGAMSSVHIAPEVLIRKAIESACPSVAYTYTEPTIYFEYAYECAQLARAQGLKNIFVTNGFMSEDALNQIHPFLDAANVDLKSMSEEFYRTSCKAELGPVLETITRMKELGIWVEVTTLVIPGANDTEDEFDDAARFIASVDKDMPWHISRFHPDYRRSGEPTSQETLQEAYAIAKQRGLSYVYIGNIASSDGESTYCPACNKLIIERAGYLVKKRNIQDGCCGFCGKEIAGAGL